MPGKARKIVLSAGVAAGALLVLELGARLWVHGPKALGYREMVHNRTEGKAGLFRAAEHPDVRFEHLPQLDGRVRFRDYRTNSRGMRDREYPLEKGADVLRIAAVGDSFTAGVEIAEEECWASVLERRLGESLGPEKVEVWNWGVPAYLLIQDVATVEHKVLATDPDLIVLGFCALNDYETPDGHWEQPFVPREPESGFTRFYLLELLKMRLRFARKVAPSEVPLRDDQRPYVEECFARLGALSRAADVPVVVLFLALYPIEHAGLRAIVKGQGLQFVDASAAFRREELSSYRAHALDYHPNAAAHARFAEVLGEALEELELLRPRAGVDGD